jgi:hypothetical protein
MDTSTSTAPYSSLRRQTSYAPSPSSFVPSGSPALAQEKGSSRAKTNRVEPIVVGLTADSDDDEGIPQRNFNSNTPVRSPVRVDITSDSGSDEPSLSTAPGKTSRVHTTPRSILDRNFYLAQAASKELYPWQRQRQKERPQQQRP